MTDIDVRSLTNADLFTNEFMRENTQWNAFAGMLDMCGTVPEDQLEGSEEWDYFVSGNTAWSTWEEMKEAALRHYMSRRA